MEISIFSVIAWSISYFPGVLVNIVCAFLNSDISTYIARLGARKLSRSS